MGAERSYSRDQNNKVTSTNLNQKVQSSIVAASKGESGERVTPLGPAECRLHLQERDE